VALDRQVIYPALALSGSEITFMGLDRHTVWQDHRNATSTYYFFFVQAPLP